MKVGGVLLVAVGLGVLVLGWLRHQSAFILKGTSHVSIFLGLIGVIVLSLGAVLLMVGLFMED
jgi:hypothetical protein